MTGSCWERRVRVVIGCSVCCLLPLAPSLCCCCCRFALCCFVVVEHNESSYHRQSLFVFVDHLFEALDVIGRWTLVDVSLRCFVELARGLRWHSVCVSFKLLGTLFVVDARIVRSRDRRGCPSLSSLSLLCYNGVVPMLHHKGVERRSRSRKPATDTRQSESHTF